MRVRSAAAALGLRASIELEAVELVLDHADGTSRWPASFIARWGDRTVYTDTHSPAVIGFAGWRPHGPRRWPAATDKLAFKRAAQAAGLNLPAACVDPAAIGGAFLVKHRRGSFGEGQRGPFLRFDPADPQQRLADGEFYENFIIGTAAKLWCWGPTCVGLALQPPLVVTGDGQRSLRALIEALATASGRPDWLLAHRLATLCGLDSLDAVTKPGQQVLVDYRYGERLARAGASSPDRWPQVRGTPLGQALAQAARAMAADMPAFTRPAPTLFTLDAVIDADGQPWWLEMNCHPLVHPAAYAAMLPDCLA